MPCTRENILFVFTSALWDRIIFFFFWSLKTETKRICETYSRLNHQEGRIFFFFLFLFYSPWNLHCLKQCLAEWAVVGACWMLLQMNPLATDPCFKHPFPYYCTTAVSVSANKYFWNYSWGSLQKLAGPGMVEFTTLMRNAPGATPVSGPQLGWGSPVRCCGWLSSVGRITGWGGLGGGANVRKQAAFSLLYCRLIFQFQCCEFLEH